MGGAVHQVGSRGIGHSELMFDRWIHTVKPDSCAGASGSTTSENADFDVHARPTSPQPALKGAGGWSSRVKVSTSVCSDIMA